MVLKTKTCAQPPDKIRSRSRYLLKLLQSPSYQGRECWMCLLATLWRGGKRNLNTYILIMNARVKKSISNKIVCIFVFALNLTNRPGHK